MTGAVNGRAVLLNTVTEETWLQQIIVWARRAGWLTYHTRDSRRSEAGFPDLVCIRGDRVLFIEAKTQRGRVTLAQTTWLQALKAVPGVEVDVLRPGDEKRAKALLEPFQ